MDRVRIVSDGNPANTQVIINGAPCPWVTEVMWRIDVNGAVPCAKAVVTFLDVEIDAQADAEVIARPLPSYGGSD